MARGILLFKYNFMENLKLFEINGCTIFSVDGNKMPSRSKDQEGRITISAILNFV